MLIGQQGESPGPSEALAMGTKVLSTAQYERVTAAIAVDMHDPTIPFEDRAAAVRMQVELLQNVQKQLEQERISTAINTAAKALQAPLSGVGGMLSGPGAGRTGRRNFLS